jgi:hypothetical protein
MPMTLIVLKALKLNVLLFHTPIFNHHFMIITKLMLSHYRRIKTQTDKAA